MRDEEVRAELEKLIYDNRELERLEAILDDFNPFVALGWTTQELRHSSFLRWLLDPSETHSLGAYFLRAFLKLVAHKSSGTSALVPSVVEVDTWDLDAAQIIQEWEGIDLLVQNDHCKLVVAIENKVLTDEHGNQLQRYRTVVEQKFPHYKRLFVYLTVGGDEPSDETYAPIAYGEVVKLIEDTLQRRADQLGPEVRGFVEHYVQMVRRHIVEDSEIQELCRQIYQKHRRALEVLFEHRPDRASEVYDILMKVVKTKPTLLQDHSSKSYVRFIPQALDFIPPKGEDWTPSKRLLLFELEHSSGRLNLKVVLGPGDQTVRDLIHEVVRRHSGVFNRATEKLYPKWWSFHIERWIGAKQYQELPLSELETDVRARLDRFLNDRLPTMIDALAELRPRLDSQQDA